ncbi:MAG: Nif3-like dinuclear metal center hexameric protein, partial [Bacteroidota bacterium]
MPSVHLEHKYHVMQLNALIRALETWAPTALQESYDNSGLITGHPEQEITGVLVSLDVTEAILDEAKARGCNVIVSHHPIVFSGLKRLTGKTAVERIIIRAIREGIALYAIHTNLDNVAHGVNQAIAARLGLESCRILSPMQGRIRQLVTYVPQAQAEGVRTALFEAGAGRIGNYSECSFSLTGTGSFKPESGAMPVIGQTGVRHLEAEERIEVLYPDWLERDVLQALRKSHPYEEIAYQTWTITNQHQAIGAGMLGKLPAPVKADAFLDSLKTTMKASVIRHTALVKETVEHIAVCGGSGSFLLPAAISAGADLFLTADFKYHQFFEADDKLIVADIGHFETEQFTIDLLTDFLRGKFTTFAVRATELNTNPVHY